MAKLVYAAITSLDGFVADDDGTIEWAEPSDHVLAVINDLERGYGTYLYGRKMYETMLYWETFEASDDEPGLGQFARTWMAADKVVYSRTLPSVTSTRTRLERSFDPEAVRRMKESSDHDLSVGGPDLAGQALGAGLIDEIHLFVTPVLLGGGTPALPRAGRCPLELVATERLADVVHVHYRLRP